MIQLLLLVSLAILAVFATRRYLASADPALARKLRRRLAWLGVLLVLLLAASGRLALLIPLFGAVLATLVRMAPVLLPLLLRYLPTWIRRRQAAASGSGDSSRVETRFLCMTLDHASGEIGGEVRDGPYAGQTLGSLDAGQLRELLGYYRRHDQESAQLLQAYLERVQGEFAPESEEMRREPATAGGRMGRQEAYQVLGLEPSASREEIIAAHRRLMQKLHPDRGGSDYLAAKINQAKDVLLAGR